MRYQGGKRRSAKYIAPVLARMSAAAPVRDIGDLFLGSAGIEQACATLAPVTLGAEICPAIIACYRAVADGWDPPARLTRDEYAAIKAVHGPDSQDPLAAFALAFCSYAGVWATGRLPDDERHGENRPTCRYAAAKARKDLLALHPVLQRMTLVCEDYRVAAERVPDGGVLYLDPPWRGTTGYKQAPPFDVDVFWIWAAAASMRWRIIISEGQHGPPAGDDRWALAWSRAVPSPGLLAGKVECLWYLRDGLAADVFRDVSVVPTHVLPSLDCDVMRSVPTVTVVGPRQMSAPVLTVDVDAQVPTPTPALEIPVSPRLAADDFADMPPIFPRLSGAPEYP